MNCHSITLHSPAKMLITTYSKPTPLNLLKSLVPFPRPDRWGETAGFGPPCLQPLRDHVGGLLGACWGRSEPLAACCIPAGTGGD